jgi:hypothetical protein
VRACEELGGFHAAMTGDDLICIIDQDGIIEPKLLDAVGNLPDLLLRMCPRIVRVRAQLVNR